MRYILCIFFLAASLSTMAQELLWQRSVGGEGSVFAVEVLSDDLGSIYVGTDIYGSGDYDLLTSEGSFDTDSTSQAALLSYSTDNDFLWDITLEAGIFSRTFGLDLQSDNTLIWYGSYQGDLVIESADSLYSFEAEAGNTFLIKLDTDGEIQWARTTLGQSRAEGVIVDADDNIFIHGWGIDPSFMDTNDEYITLNTNPPISDPFDGYIAKLDSQGKMLWAQAVGGTGHDRITDIELMSNGDIAINGFYHSTTGFDSIIDLDFSSGELITEYSNGSNMFLMRIDSEGEPVWIRHSQVLDEEYGTYVRESDIIVDGQDNIYFCGHHRGEIELIAGEGVILDDDTLGEFTAYSEMVLARISPDGSLDWAFELENYAPEEILQWDLPARLFFDPSGNLLMTGRFAGFSDFDPVASTGEVNGQGGFDGFIASYSIDGELLGVNTLGGEEHDAIYHWHQDVFGSEFLLGYHATDQIFNYESLSIDLDTVGVGRESFIIKLGETVGLNETFGEADFKVYPSPAADWLNLRFDRPNDYHELIIIDARGEIVQREAMTPALEHQINISNLASGSYILRIGSQSRSFIKL